jgi:hypothetical protein
MVMSFLNAVALVVHILSIAGVMALLLMQLSKSPKRIPLGTFHAAVTALVAGLFMVAIRHNLHEQNADKWPLLNNSWVGLKFLILMTILVLISKNYKKSQIKNSLLYLLIALTTTNILIAILW